LPILRRYLLKLRLIHFQLPRQVRLLLLFDQLQFQESLLDGLVLLLLLGNLGEKLLLFLLVLFEELLVLGLVLEFFGGELVVEGEF
jgi:hypothetical protein